LPLLPAHEMLIVFRADAQKRCAPVKALGIGATVSS
jgi:hypothetical protein